MKLDPSKTALLTLDFQKGILDFVPGAETVIPTAAKAAEFARKKQFQIAEKVFPRQATVLTVDDFIAEQGAD